MTARTLGAALLCLAASATPAGAHHDDTLRTEGLSPLAAALLWAGVAFLVGLAIVGIVTVLARRRP